MQNVFPSPQEMNAAYHRATYAVYYDDAFYTHQEAIRYRYEDDWPAFVLTVRLTCRLGKDITTPLFVPLMMVRGNTSFFLERAYVAGLLPGRRLMIDAAICESIPGLLLAQRMCALRGEDMHHCLQTSIRIMFVNRWVKGLYWLVRFEPAIAFLNPSVFGFDFPSWYDAVNTFMWE